MVFRAGGVVLSVPGGASGPRLKFLVAWAGRGGRRYGAMPFESRFSVNSGGRARLEDVREPPGTGSGGRNNR